MKALMRISIAFLFSLSLLTGCGEKEDGDHEMNGDHEMEQEQGPATPDTADADKY